MSQPDIYEVARSILTSIDFFASKVASLSSYLKSVCTRSEDANRSLFFQGLGLTNLSLHILDDFEEIRESVVDISSVPGYSRIQISFTNFVEHVIKLIHALLVTKRTHEEKKLTITFIGKVLERNHNTLPNNFTMLHLCVFMEPKYFNVIETILKYGGNIHAKDVFGRTPLHVAIDIAASSEVLNFLIRQGAFLDIPDYAGNLPITEIRLREDANDIDTSSYINLKGLAARVIYKYNIPYRNKIPKSLEPLIESCRSLYGPRLRLRDD